MVNIEQAKCTGCGACVNDYVAVNLKLQNGKAERSGPRKRYDTAPRLKLH